MEKENIPDLSEDDFDIEFPAPPEDVNKEKPPMNILKTRDDRKPVKFIAAGDDGFAIKSDPKPSWAENEYFQLKDLRQRIEPWLTALFQSEHLTLLAGSGLTHAIHRLATGKLAAGMDRASFKTHGSEIEQAANKSAGAAARKKANIEDDLRAANELLRGIEILDDTDAPTLKKEITELLRDFSKKILLSETGIAEADWPAREKALNTLVNFLMSFASRTGTRDRLNLFTTNYDRLLETGSELAGLHLLDRFIGNLTPIFRSSRLDLDMHYNPPGIRGEPRYLEGVARFTKLHGSVDWVQVRDEIRRIGMPFGANSIKPHLDIPGGGEIDAHELMIYPNAAKDSETAQYPYVELFRDFASALCRPNSTLVAYGYSFGDEHINRIIRDMLTIPSTHLVIIAYGDELGRIKENYNRIGRPSQISLLIGPELADISVLTESFLPKSAIDRTTSRMSDLLKMRYGTKEAEKKTNSEEPAQ